MENLKYIGLGALVVLTMSVGITLLLGFVALVLNYPWFGAAIGLPLFVFMLWVLGKSVEDNTY